MLVVMFPGQGSQKKGMGADLFDAVEEYRAVEREVDALLGYSLRRLVLDDPGGQLRQTQFTQPALYVVNALHHYAGVRKGRRPDFVAGHSLGEYNALLAAGAFDLLTGLRLVQKRGQLMSGMSGGGMAAVVGIGPTKVRQVLAEAGLTALDIANYNSPAQTILSGPSREIEAARAPFEAAGASMYVPLPVSAAFHSRYMDEIVGEFAAFLDAVEFRELNCPVIANYSALPYPMRDAAAIRSSLTRQITQPVLWSQSVRYLLDRKADTFIETGPGQVLTNLVAQIRASAGL